MTVSYSRCCYHYSASEILALSFAGEPPDPADLCRRWHAIIATASPIVALLPPDEAGRCVLDRDGRLFRGGCAELRDALARNALLFHQGSIRGAFPRIT